MPLAKDDAEVVGVPGEEHLRFLIPSARGNDHVSLYLKTYAHAAHVVHAAVASVVGRVHGHVLRVVHVSVVHLDASKDAQDAGRKRAKR